MVVALQDLLETAQVTQIECNFRITELPNREDSRVLQLQTRMTHLSKRMGLALQIMNTPIIKERTQIEKSL